MMVNKKSSIRKKSQGDYQKEYVSSAKRGLIEKLFLALAVIMLCACSSDDELESSFNGANATGGVTYLTVNLREVGSSTRADDGGYASGSDAEHNVANAYFYFYDNNGNYITRGSVTNVSESETSPNTPTSMTSGNIEWNSNTVVAVYGLEEGNFPTKMVTVVNQPSGFNASHLSFDEMTTKLAGTPYADASGNFVMSTSVYYNGGDGIIYNYTTLNSNNFALEPINVDGDYTNGSATPVEVYVERLAAKVEVSLDESLTQPIPITITNAGSESLENGVNVQLLGWNVDGTARDAYMVKQVEGWIASDFGNTSWTWQSVSDHRSYWAKSPNYGDTETIYPTSSNGNTDTEEANANTWLNGYLKYTSLANAINFPTSETSTYAYCGENTNTTAVLGNASSTALTNVLVKAQAQDASGNPIDLVEYNGMYYTTADFCQNYISDNVATIVKDFIEEFSAIYNYDFSSAIYTDGIYLTDSVSNHKVAFNSTISNLHSFGGNMLSLYNANDGNVNAYYKGVTARYGENGDGNIINPETEAKYLDSDVVYSNDVNFGNYEFWVKVNYSNFTACGNSTITSRVLLLDAEGENSGYYFPIDNDITFNVQNTSCTWRNYLLSILTDDADYANTQYAASSYPNYFNNGLMYYHVPIEHLNTTTGTSLVLGQYGVVRNHWYDITINSIASMGRGIAKEDEVIVPIGNNGIQTNSIGASTKIYSWKEYDQTVIF